LIVRKLNLTFPNISSIITPEQLKSFKAMFKTASHFSEPPKLDITLLGKLF